MLNIDRTEIHLSSRKVTPLTEKHFKKILDQVGKLRKPLAYVFGDQNFMGISFKVVAKTILIPRPETECLVELALKKIRSHHAPGSKLNILDIGTGSGCIGLSLWHFLQKDYKVFLVLNDISKKALRVARINASNLGISKNSIQYDSSNIRHGFPGVRHSRPSPEAWDLPSPRGTRGEGGNPVFNLIISNPPYIPSKDWNSLAPEIKRWEPKIALIAGRDGLDLIRPIVTQAKKFLTPQGMLILEIDHRQAKKVRVLMLKNSYKDVEIFKDMEGRDRIAYGRL